MNDIKAANKIIKDGIVLLPDDAKKEFCSQANPEVFVNEAISNAMAAIHGDHKNEMEALLKAYAIQEANRVVTTLWRLQLLPEDMEKAYRELPTMQSVADFYNGFLNGRKERMDEVMAAHKKISEEERELDIFKGIINGVSAKEAEKKYEQFKKSQQQAMGVK